ncbi:MAG: hypothetical protein AB3A66_20985 [Nodularia sp. CChRGM 3473]
MNWPTVQTSLAAFYNTSQLGESFIFDERGTRVVRAPQRIYGIEATLDWQLGNNWLIGSTVSWQEGENDPNNDGNYQPLGSTTISPLKLTAYVEHQTTPGWRNRLQLLHVGSRNRAFEEEVDILPVNNYLLVDYISSIKIGQGTLNIGIENLFDQQYFPVPSQVDGGFSNTFRFAGRGRTLGVNYRIYF